MSVAHENRKLNEESSALGHVTMAVQQRLDECPYAFIYSFVEFEYDQGRLTLCGRVPSFYLKQMLQELLRDIEHVRQIENHVDVVNSNGLSSVPADACG